MVSQKVKSLSWAAPHFSEINQVLGIQASTIREAFQSVLSKGRKTKDAKNQKAKLRVSLQSFRSFLNDLGISSLDSVQKTRKLEAALRLEEPDNTEDDIDFILLEACLSEYDDIEEKLE